MISVVMAVYKGDKFIQEQILSILPQLKNEDEIIVSDDRPGGTTERIVKRIAAEDNRVIYVEGKNKGSVANIVNALRYCKGDKIYFCEHKDVWLPDKVKRVEEAFAGGADLVVHNAYIADELLNITDYSLFQKAGINKLSLSSIRKSGYFLSCIAIRRKLLKKIMPIPRSVPSVGQWVGIIGSIYGKRVLIDIPLIYSRMTKRQRVNFDNNLKIDKRGKRVLISKLYKRIITGN